MQTTATAWLALDSAGGPFAVGLVLAARMLPNLLFGLAAGTLADRSDRRRQVITVGLAAFPVMLALGRVASAGSVEVWLLVLLSFAIGCQPVFDTPARQALVMDTVPRDLAANAMALNATASRLCIALGAFVAGLAIPFAGIPSVYVAVGTVYVVSAGLVMLVAPSGSHASRSHSQHLSFGQSFREAGRLLVDNPAVRLLVAAGVACEVFGFSYQTAVPAFARDVLGAGAEGLGALNATTSFGGAAALIALSMLPGRVPREPVLAGVFVVYGLSLVTLAQSTSLQIAAAVLFVTGGCAAAFDVLQQTLLQLSVPEHQRGRAVGVWVLGIGSAPIGHLQMGTLAATVGTPVGLVLNGCIVLVAAATLLARAENYRLGRKKLAAPDL